MTSCPYQYTNIVCSVTSSGWSERDGLCLTYRIAQIFEAQKFRETLKICEIFNVRIKIS